jgi:hypothetical protein
MKTIVNKQGRRIIVFLSRTDMELLVYTTSDIWITPELKKYKREILERVRLRNR